MPGKRVRILCEDRNTERFLRRLCDRFDVEVLRVALQPAGEGAASAWVRRQYVDNVVWLRSRSYQQGLGLLVGIDGDNRGRLRRLRELEDALRSAEQPPRSASEPIAIFTPTWSIETWLARLCGHPNVREDSSIKFDATHRHLWEKGSATKPTLRAAVDAWGIDAEAVASLSSAYEEASRVWLA